MVVIKSTSIEIRSGMLLSKEILEQMNYQSNLFRLQYSNYPDGIIYGLELLEEDDLLYLSPGLVKQNGQYFFSADRINLFELLDEFDDVQSIDFTGYYAVAFVSREAEQVNEGIISACLELKLCERNKLMPDDIIVSEFQYHNKKRKWNYNNRSPIEKLTAQLHCENYYYTFMNVRYSMSGENVFSPHIYRLMKACLSEKNNKSAADMALLFTLSQNQIVSFEVLNEWFKCNGVTIECSDRKKVIEAFLNYVRSEAPCKETIAESVKVSEPPKEQQKSRADASIW